MYPPLVSVNMTTFHANEHIDQAIESILKQTYRNLELIIINADPEMHDKLEWWKSKDCRIVLTHKYNYPISPSRTLALKMSRGKYIAIHDADDFSDLTRIEKQVDYMEKHPDIGGVGSYLTMINDDKDNTIFHIKMANLPFLIRFYAYFECPIGHGTVMYRKSTIEKFKLKYRGFANGFPEDYDFLLQMLHYTDLANIPEYLYTYRCGIGNSCNNKKTNARLAWLVPIVQRSAMFKKYRCIVDNNHFKRDMLVYIIKHIKKERLNPFKIAIVLASFCVFTINHRKTLRKLEDLRMKDSKNKDFVPLGLEI